MSGLHKSKNRKLKEKIIGQDQTSLVVWCRDRRRRASKHHKSRFSRLFFFLRGGAQSTDNSCSPCLFVKINIYKNKLNKLKTLNEVSQKLGTETSPRGSGSWNRILVHLKHSPPRPSPHERPCYAENFCPQFCILLISSY